MTKSPSRIPEQATRLIILLVVAVTALVTARAILIPEDFGEYGHFRSSAIDENISVPIKYAGQAICADCHDDVVEVKEVGYHRGVACEVCHGPAAAHVEDEESVELRVPRGRGYCPLCHEYLPSRPTGFPQVVSASHNPIQPCVRCHEPHDPTPPETPQECSACHATIARTKSVSHHAYVECTQCHETPVEHKISPRVSIPTKPNDRAFCGGCHSRGVDAPPGTPTVNMVDHGENYVCWQCHYPHLPQAR